MIFLMVKNTSLVNTNLRFASLKAECWRKANLKEEEEKDPNDSQNRLIEAGSPLDTPNSDLSN